jgi:adenylate cyclase
MSTVEIRLYEHHRLVDTWQATMPLVVGRQDVEFGEPGAGPCDNQRFGAKVVVAGERFNRIPRYLCRLTAGESGRVVIENIHERYPVVVQAHGDVPPGGKRDFEMPAVILLGQRAIRVGSSDSGDEAEDEAAYRSLVSEPIDPDALTIREFARKTQDAARQVAGRNKSADMVELLQHVLPVIREAANTDAFYSAAANAAIRIARLDRAAVFSIDGGGHRVLRVEHFRGVSASSASDDKPPESAPRATYDDGTDPTVLQPDQRRLRAMKDSAPAISGTIVERLLRETKTQIFDNLGPAPDSQAPSLRQIHQVVAAPILGKHRRVVGILYGDRWTQTGPSPRKLQDVEAKLVEILAGAIAAGRARLDEEEQRSRMSGFFSEVVAKQLAEDPTLLEPREADVSVMFCDVRGFSAISEKLGPVGTVEWMHDVLSELSQCVVDTGGVLVNYVGDELMAMWGAPNPQPDHATRSLQAAARILTAVDRLDERWHERIGQPLRVGIGINSGAAAVGNTGSRLKFQYGVYGNVVNASSRLQSASKQFTVDCLVATATLERANVELPKRRLATIAMVGIEEPIEVWQLLAEAPEGWDDLANGYETALAEYESQQFGEAARRLGQVLERFADDQPSRRLLAQAVNELSMPSEDFSPIDRLSVK